MLLYYESNWSGIGESNSYDNLGKVTGNHYINPA
jgi:hypothetical protein